MSEVRDEPMPGQDADQKLVLREALARLAPGQRAVIVLRYFDDLTEVQTADALGISVGTVKSQSPRRAGPAPRPGARPHDTPVVAPSAD